MIATGVMKATPSLSHPFSVSIPLGEHKRRVTYFVGNPDAIPYYLRQALECGEPIAGLFYFAEHDQFAHYLEGEYEPSVGESTSVLVDAVIEEAKKQIEKKDLTSLDELLRFIPKENLIQFLPEGEWGKYRS